MIRKSKHSVIKYAKIFLQLEDSVVVEERHVNEMKRLIQELVDSGLSPREVKEIYNIEHSNFAAFLRHFGIKLKTIKESVNSYRERSGTKSTDEKKNYYRDCCFKFDPYSDETVRGYDLLIRHGIYHPITNKEGVCRDHILSKAVGFRNKIDPKIISHKANCQFLCNSDNVKKGEECWITLNELTYAIEHDRHAHFSSPSKRKFIPKSEEHKRKLSELNRMYMMITDETDNLRVLKTDEMPEGFRKGFIRKKVHVTGVEPASLRNEA